MCEVPPCFGLPGHQSFSEAKPLGQASLRPKLRPCDHPTNGSLAACVSSPLNQWLSFLDAVYKLSTFSQASMRVDYVDVTYLELVRPQIGTQVDLFSLQSELLSDCLAVLMDSK